MLRSARGAFSHIKTVLPVTGPGHSMRALGQILAEDDAPEIDGSVGAKSSTRMQHWGLAKNLHFASHPFTLRATDDSGIRGDLQ